MIPFIGWFGLVWVVGLKNTLVQNVHGISMGTKTPHLCIQQII
jgi:hypothetical protein